MASPAGGDAAVDSHVPVVGLHSRVLGECNPVGLWEAALGEVGEGQEMGSAGRCGRAEPAELQSLHNPGHLGGLPGTFSFLTGQSA